MKLTPARALAAAVVVLTLAAGAGCSGSNDADSSAAGGSSGSAVRPDVGAADAAEGPAPADAEAVADKPAETVLDAQALIRKGTVSLRSHDVGKAQLEAQKIADTYAGQVTDEKTTTDDDGDPAYTRMVLRIPSDDFARAMEDLKGIDVAELESADTSEDDVTARLIDTKTRLEVQRRSIDRITVLFEQAVSIRDVMAIEAQLSRRQAELESLERQAAYLADQTTMSTIVVVVDEIPEKVAAPPSDKAGFVTGLEAGWKGLTAFAVALATIVGALLPWLIVVAILGPPLLLLLRAVRRRRPAPPAAS
jgi:hypothetical protein